MIMSQCSDMILFGVCIATSFVALIVFYDNLIIRYKLQLKVGAHAGFLMQLLLNWS